MKFADYTEVSLWSSFVLVEGEESSGHIGQKAIWVSFPSGDLRVSEAVLSTMAVTSPAVAMEHMECGPRHDPSAKSAPGFKNLL